jgi:hypothetical protein
MQVRSDWEGRYTTENFEKEFKLRMYGPGLYMTKTDTLLVTPECPKTNPDHNTIWHGKQPEGTIWLVQVYNCQFQDCILSCVSLAPCRHDSLRVQSDSIT